MAKYRRRSSKGMGDRLRLIRTLNRLTLKEFGRLISDKTTTTTVSRWEKDGVTPQDSTLDKIANLFGVTKEWILHGAGGCNLAGAVNDLEGYLLFLFGELSPDSKRKFLEYMAAETKGGGA